MHSFCLQTVSHELEEEALHREAEVKEQLRNLQQIAAAKDLKHMEEVKAKDQQISELQVTSITVIMVLGFVVNARPQQVSELQVALPWSMCRVCGQSLKASDQQTSGPLHTSF